jgi:hypothetical protein
MSDVTILYPYRTNYIARLRTREKKLVALIHAAKFKKNGKTEQPMIICKLKIGKTHKTINLESDDDHEDGESAAEEESAAE